MDYVETTKYNITKVFSVSLNYKYLVLIIGVNCKIYFHKLMIRQYVSSFSGIFARATPNNKCKLLIRSKVLPNRAYKKHYRIR